MKYYFHAGRGYVQWERPVEEGREGESEAARERGGGVQQDEDTRAGAGERGGEAQVRGDGGGGVGGGKEDEGLVRARAR
jgi:hypothetical protein